MVQLKPEAFLWTIVHVLGIAHFSDYKKTSHNTKTSTKKTHTQKIMHIITTTIIKQYYYNIVYNSIVKIL